MPGESKMGRSAPAEALGKRSSGNEECNLASWGTSRTRQGSAVPARPTARADTPGSQWRNWVDR
jgi:hypothetical protein